MKSKKSGKGSPATDSPDANCSDAMHATVNRHLRAGWWGLLIFMAMGSALEAMHGLKLSFYLDVRNEVRHTMWTLAHAHGTLLSLVNLAFALVLIAVAPTKIPRIASNALLIGWMLMPLGFFLGGVGHLGGDPGIGVLLVPAGAVFLLAAMFDSAIKLHFRSST